MQIILIVVVALMILFGLKEWAEDHLLLVIGIGVFLLAWFFLGFWKAVILVAVLVATGVLALTIWSWISARNEENLKNYLENNCGFMGYMTPERWREQLPQYANRSYTTSFEQITTSFAKEKEKAVFVKSPDLSWVKPYTDYLMANIMGPIYELEKIPNPAMQNTHYLPDAALIYHGLSCLKKYKIIDGAPVLEEVHLNDDAVRPFLPAGCGTSIPEYYLVSFKLTDAFVNTRHISSDSFESEEISLDDLEDLS